MKLDGMFAKQTKKISKGTNTCGLEHFELLKPDNEIVGSKLNESMIKGCKVVEINQMTR